MTSLHGIIINPLRCILVALTIYITLITCMYELKPTQIVKCHYCYK